MTATRPQASRYEDVIDLERYPIHDRASSKYQALVQGCRDQLRDRGVAQLDGFLAPAAVGEMVALAGQLAAQAWASDQTHTVYFEPPDDSAGPDHPRAVLQHSAKKAIAYDQIPAAAPIRRLYESDDLTAFIAAVLGKPVLYRSADPLDALEIAIFDEDDELGWHFDNSEFSVTVMYAQSEAGGHFDYYPALRTEHDDNYPGVQNVLLGRAGRRHQAGHEPRLARGFPRPARPAPGHPGQRAAPADQLSADLRRTPGDETERAHPETVLRPHRLTGLHRPHC